MGTNYYVKPNFCQYCNHKPEDVHIGKNSMGWKFGFNNKFKTAKEWFEYLSDKRIYDEYDRPIPLCDLREIITNSMKGIWLYDPKYPEKESYNESDKLEFLDCDGYRIINSDGRWS